MSKPIIFKTELVLPILNTKLDTWPPEPIDPSLPCKPVTRRVHPKLRYQVGDVLWVRETWGIGCRPHPYLGWVDGVEFKADEFFLEGEYDILPLYPSPENIEIEEIRDGWHPSIHMPKWAARIWLRVVEAGMERLQDITEEEARREGVPPFTHGADYRKGECLNRPLDSLWCQNCKGEGMLWCGNEACAYEKECPECDTDIKLFRNLWDSINAKRGYAWDTNPTVARYAFVRIEKPTDNE